MISSYRRTGASIFLVAILAQVLLPVYFARAVVGAAAGTTVGAGLCVSGATTGAVAALVGNAIDSVLTVPVADRSASFLLATIEATNVVNCTANSGSLGNQTQESFIQHVVNVAAYAAINIVLQTITRQIIGWIQGKDSGFVQNLEAEALRTADAEAGGLLVDLTGVNLCGNIGAFLKLSIGVPGASVRQRFQCSVTGIVQNVENFYQNFADGGWPAFFQISLEPQNNAYGAFLLTMNEQFQRQNGAQATLQQKLAEWSGFKGFEVSREGNCRIVNAEDAGTMQQYVALQSQNGKPNRVVHADTSDPETPAFTVCDVAYDTKTPGKLFADALPVAAFSGVRRAELANTIDQALGQIVMALLQRIIKESTSGGKGLFGSSDIGTPPSTTLADAGFHPTYIINQTDDSSLRLEASQTLLDAKIQNLDTQIASINGQIASLQKICADNPPACDQKQIDQLNTNKTPLTRDRAAQITSLTRAQSNLSYILDLRTRLLAATDPTLLQNLDIKLTAVQSDVEQIIQQAGGPPIGQNGVDADDNFVRIATNAQDRATVIVAYLETRITAEIDPIKKAALMKARDDLKKLADDLGILRTAFLAAIANQTGTASIMTQITGKIGEINDKILNAYAL